MWLDKGVLLAGQDWGVEIDEAILASYAVVVVMSPEAQASEYVTYEWSFAIGAGVQVIPVLHRPTPLHPRLARLHYLDFTAPAERPWEEFTQAVGNAVRLREFHVVRVPRTAPPHVKNAVASLDATDQAERKMAVVLLAESEHPAAREALRSALRHPMPDVRRGAAERLAREPEALPVLIEAALRDDIEPVKLALLRHGAAAVRALLNLLGGDTDADVRSIALVLRHFPADIIRPHLLRLLQDADPRIRRDAVLLMPYIKSRGASEEFGSTLIGVLRDPNREVRRAAAEVALGENGLADDAVRFFEALSLIFHDSDAAARSAALAAEDDAALRKMIAHMETLLRSERFYVALSAYMALRKIENKRFIFGGTSDQRLAASILEPRRRLTRYSPDYLVPGRIYSFYEPSDESAGIYVLLTQEAEHVEIGALCENPETNEYEVAKTQKVLTSEFLLRSRPTGFKLPTADDPTFIDDAPEAGAGLRAGQDSAAASPGGGPGERGGNANTVFDVLWFGLWAALQCGSGLLLLYVRIKRGGAGFGPATLSEPYNIEIRDLCVASLGGVGLALLFFGLRNLLLGLSAAVNLLPRAGRRGKG